MRKKLISMSIISTSLTVRTQPSPRFHVKNVVTFRSCEIDYYKVSTDTMTKEGRTKLNIVAS